MLMKVPSQEIDLSKFHAVFMARRIKNQVDLYTTSSLESPRIRAITLKPVTRLPIKDSWTFTYRELDDNLFDMQGAQSTLTAAELYAQIKTWASSEDTPAPLLMRAPHTIFDNKYVFIEPESVRPIQWVTDDKTEKQLIAIGQATVFRRDNPWQYRGPAKIREPEIQLDLVHGRMPDSKNEYFVALGTGQTGV